MLVETLAGLITLLLIAITIYVLFRFLAELFTMAQCYKDILLDNYLDHSVRIWASNPKRRKTIFNIIKRKKQEKEFTDRIMESHIMEKERNDLNIME